MRSLVAAVVLVILLGVAGPSRASPLWDFRELEADVDGRIAELTGELTRQQRKDKRRLRSIARKLRRKSGTMPGDLKLVLKVAKLIEKHYADDARMADELEAGLDDVEEKLELAYWRLSNWWVLRDPPTAGAYDDARHHLAAAERSMASAESATTAVDRATELRAAARSMYRAERPLGKPMIEVTPSELDFGQFVVEPRDFGDPIPPVGGYFDPENSSVASQPVTFKNTGVSVVEVIAYRVNALTGQYDGGFMFDDNSYSSHDTTKFVLAPGQEAELKIGIRDASAGDGGHVYAITLAHRLTRYTPRGPVRAHRVVTLAAEPVYPD